jgi:hypothetical protein
LVALSRRSWSREQDREIKGLIDVLGTRTQRAALQTIEIAAGLEIGPNLVEDAFVGHGIGDEEHEL